MESRNPAFARSQVFSRGGYATFDTSPSQLQEMYDAPAATALQTGRMTIDDVVMKTAALFGVMLAFAAVSWIVLVDSKSMAWVPFAAMFVGLVLGLVIGFKQSTNKALILTYAAVEGLFIGGISKLVELYYPAVVGQAALGTLVTFAGMLVLYRARVIKATEKFKSVMIVAVGGYFILAMVNLVLSLMGVGDGWGFRGPNLLGLALSAVGVALASLMLILDFDYIEDSVRRGVPEKYAWLAGFGLLATLIWLYIELLRLLMILREMFSE